MRAFHPKRFVNTKRFSALGYYIMKLKLITLLLLLFTALVVKATEIWVSPTGNDRAPGTNEAPKATLASAIRQAREYRRLSTPGIETGIQIMIKGGVYSLYEPLFIRPEDSGTTQYPTIIQGVEGEKVSISGGVKITNWKKSGKFWVSDVPTFNGRPLDFRQLWVNGRKAVRARDVVDFEKMYRIINNDPVNEILWVPTVAVKSILKAPYAEMVLHEMWCIANLRIKSIEVHGDSAAIRFHNPESRLQFEHPWPRPMLAPGLNSPFYLTNAMELLDQQGEWYHDINTHKLYYYPFTGEKIKQAEAIVPALETLLIVEGTPDRPVENIVFKNINFNYTTWMRPSEKGHVPLQAGMFLTDAYTLKPKMIRDDNNHKLDNQAWLGRPASAVQVSDANKIDFRNCRFEHIGSTALDYIAGDKAGTVEGCIFRDIAGNGLVIGGFSPPAQEVHLTYDPADNREVCSYQHITNNYFTDVTNEDWGCVAICAGYVRNINIEHNEISDVSYTGISLGWGWNQTVNCMRNNRVYANNIFHYAKHMYDVAGIYTLGVQPKTVISENYIHDIYKPGYVHDPDHWYYLYTDEGSSFITIKNNWTEGEKFLRNVNGPGNTWENNGPMVNDSIKSNAGISRSFLYLKN